jgi:small subunit ribosomal protein S20
VKAARQAVKRNTRNSQARSHYKTIVKKLKTALATPAKDKAKSRETLQPLLNDAQRVLMKAASKNLIKFKTASRHVARLSTAVHRALS